MPGIDGHCDINYWYKDGFSAGGSDLHVECRAHVAKYGWLPAVRDGATAGTTGESLRLEALRVALCGSDYADGSSVEVDANVSGLGWQGWDSPSPSEGGTTGQYRAVEAVRLRLTGEAARDYDVWYRVHAAGYGWMGWAKNGEDAGTTGLSCRLEAVQVRLVKKGGEAPTAAGCNVSFAFRKAPMSIECRAHVAKYGWLPAVRDGATAGTTGESLRLEALRVALCGSDYADGSSVEVDANVSGLGWQGWDSPSPSEGGTTGQYRAVEAVRLRLTGEAARDYDVWYRVHAAGYGWMGWAKNGEDAGTTGLSCRLEAVQVRLVKKGGEAPTAAGCNVSFAFRKAPMSIECRAHVAKYGWLPAVRDGATAGTTGESLRLEALRVALCGSDYADGSSVEVDANVSGLGWQGWDSRRPPRAAPRGSTAPSRPCA